MDNLKMIQEVVYYIETNLYTDINPSELCQTHDISEFHFQHFFKGIIGCPFVDYVNKRRISDQLYRWVSCHRKWSLVEVATMSKIGNVHSLSKKIKTAFNTTAKKYFKNFDGSELYPPFNFMKYTSIEHFVFDKKARILMMDEKVLIGKSISTHSYKNQHLKDMSILKDEIDLYYNHTEHLSDFNPHEISLIYNSSIDCNAGDNLDFEYFDGYHVVDTSKCPTDFRVMKIPKQQYLCFRTYNTVEAVERTLAYIYTDYLIKNPIRLKNTGINFIEKYSTEKCLTGTKIVELYIPVEYK